MHGTLVQPLPAILAAHNAGQIIASAKTNASRVPCSFPCLILPTQARHRRHSPPRSPR